MARTAWNAGFSRHSGPKARGRHAANPARWRVPPGTPTSGQFSRWGPAQRAAGPRTTRRRFARWRARPGTPASAGTAGRRPAAPSPVLHAASSCNDTFWRPPQSRMRILNIETTKRPLCHASQESAHACNKCCALPCLLSCCSVVFSCAIVQGQTTKNSHWLHDPCCCVVFHVVRCPRACS